MLLSKKVGCARESAVQTAVTLPFVTTRRGFVQLVVMRKDEETKIIRESQIANDITTTLQIYLNCILFRSFNKMRVIALCSVFFRLTLEQQKMTRFQISCFKLQKLRRFCPNICMKKKNCQSLVSIIRLNMKEIKSVRSFANVRPHP